MFRLHYLKGSHVGCYCLSSIIIMGFSQIEFGMALPTTIWLPCYFSKFCKLSLNLSIFWWYKTYFVRHDVFGKHVMSEHLPKLKMKTIEGGLCFLSCDVLLSFLRKGHNKSLRGRTINKTVTNQNHTEPNRNKTVIWNRAMSGEQGNVCFVSSPSLETTSFLMPISDSTVLGQFFHIVLYSPLFLVGIRQRFPTI